MRDLSNYNVCKTIVPSVLEWAKLRWAHMDIVKVELQNVTIERRMFLEAMFEVKS